MFSGSVSFSVLYNSLTNASNEALRLYGTTNGGSLIGTNLNTGVASKRIPISAMDVGAPATASAVVSGVAANARTNSGLSGYLGTGVSYDFLITDANAQRYIGKIAAVNTNSFDASLDSDLIFYTAKTGTLAEKVRINAAGYLGVGTASPSALFSVGATSQFQVSASGNVTGGTYNGNTITTGTGNMNLGSYTLALTGNSNINQNLLSTSSPTFANMTLAFDGTHKADLAVDASGNLQLKTTTGYTKLNAAGIQNYLQIYDSLGTSYLQLSHNGTNASISTNTGNIELGTAGDLTLASGVNIVGEGNFKIKGDATSRTITLGDTTKANDDIVTIDASNWSVATSGMINGTVDGVGTKVNNGALVDGSFVGTAINGLTAIDSANGRFYFRYGSAWHYVNQTGGFQIPNYETAPRGELTEQAILEAQNSLPFEKTNFPNYLTAKINAGDLLIPYADQYMPDGAIHGLYARFADVKEIMFDEVNKKFVDSSAEVQGLTLKTDQNITTTSDLQKSIDEQLLIVKNNLTKNESNILEMQKNFETEKQNSLAMKTNLQAQIDQIKNITASTEIELLSAKTELNAQDVGLLKIIFGITADSDSNVSIAGKLKATEIEGGKFVISVNDAEKRTVGDAKILKVVVDENGDGIDDVSGSNGKSLEIKTKSIVEKSKIFLTLKIPTAQPLAVIQIKNGEGFVVSFKDIVTEDVDFSWFMIEEK
jgi:hypothetical protein